MAVVITREYVCDIHQRNCKDSGTVQPRKFFSLDTGKPMKVDLCDTSWTKLHDNYLAMVCNAVEDKEAEEALVAARKTGGARKKLKGPRPDIAALREWFRANQGIPEIAKWTPKGNGQVTKGARELFLAHNPEWVGWQIGEKIPEGWEDVINPKTSQESAPPPSVPAALPVVKPTAPTVQPQTPAPPQAGHTGTAVRKPKTPTSPVFQAAS